MVDSMKKETERKCVATGVSKPAEALLRFVKTDDGRLIPDFNKKLPGRGLYVSNSRRALQKALAKNLFVKSIHQNLKISSDFLEIVENLLYRKGLDAINLARKTGALLTGFEKVKEQIVKNKVAFLIEAVDAGQDGAEKMAAISKDLEVFKLYKTEDLDVALNKVNTVHIAVLKSEIAAMVYENLKKYQAFRD